MPKLFLTELSIKALSLPERGQITYWDERLANFGLRLSQGGSKSFVIVFGVNRQRKTLGRYPIISLAEARSKAKQMLAEITLGVSFKKTLSFVESRGLFLAACIEKNKQNTVDYYRKRLDKHFKFGRKRLNDITRDDIQSRIAKIRTSPSEKNHAFVVIRTFLNWAVREGHLEKSPVFGMKPPGQRRVRDHVLTDPELCKVYKHSLNFPYPFGPIVSLLLLTGQRRNQIASLQWEWIDLSERTFHFPASITKNRKAHILPYGDLVANILQDVLDTGPYLFPSRGGKGDIFNGWGKSKSRFDAGLRGVSPYKLHDLRRTFSTTHARIGTPLHVTEKMLNHISGSISGVAAIYNRHSYIEEMKVATIQYDSYLIGLSA